MDYVTGKWSQAEVSDTQTGRSARREFAWCWDVAVPKPPPTGEIHTQVFVDGIHLPYGWTLLVACTTSAVINWVWASGETTAAYERLLAPIPDPDLVATDGGQGAISAIKNTWKTTRKNTLPKDADGKPCEHVTLIQRCLVHVHRNTIKNLTRQPRTLPGRALLALSAKLTTIHTTEDASAWLARLNDFGTTYRDFINEVTYARNDAERAAAGTDHWYTHERLRQAYRRLVDLSRKGHLFAYLQFAPARQATTNQVESVNARIRASNRIHRGLSEEHMTRAIDWALYQRTENPRDPLEILAQWDKAGQPASPLIPINRKRPRPGNGAPRRYDTHFDPADGNGIQQGWAGRWNQ